MNIHRIALIVFLTFSILVTLVYGAPPEEYLCKIEKDLQVAVKLSKVTNIKVVQELESCYLAYVSPGTFSYLNEIGVRFHPLDEAEGKTYFLVYLSGQDRFPELSRHGEALLLENNTALFWLTPRIHPREVLPGDFAVKELPEESIVLELIPQTAGVQQVFQVDPVIYEIAGSVSKDSVRSFIQDLQDFETRYASTEKCEQAGTYIYRAFSGFGLDVEYEPFDFYSYSTRNIIGTHWGEADPEAVVIICAHYDSTSNDSGNLAPGADDNAGGSSAVMEAAKILSNYSFDFTIRFICFSAEEWGLYGSQDYALRAVMERERILGVVNLDMIGYADSIPEDLDIITNSASEWMGRRFLEISQAYTGIPVVTAVRPSFVYSDHSPFWEKGFYAFLGIEDQNINNPYYHRTTDTIDTLDLDFCTEAVRTSLAMVADLAQPSGTPYPPRGITARSQIVYSLMNRIKTVVLQWSGSRSEGVVSYNVYRTQTPHYGYKKINNIPVSGFEYIDRNLRPDQVYFYTVTAVDSSLKESHFSAEVRDNADND